MLKSKGGASKTKTLIRVHEARVERCESVELEAQNQDARGYLKLSKSPTPPSKLILA